jgi:methyl-accepting chemotaxis protein
MKYAISMLFLLMSSPVWAAGESTAGTILPWILVVGLAVAVFYLWQQGQVQAQASANQLQKFTRALEKVTEGELDARWDIEGAQGEWKVLSKISNKMVEGLSEQLNDATSQKQSLSNEIAELQQALSTLQNDAAQREQNALSEAQSLQARLDEEIAGLDAFTDVLDQAVMGKLDMRFDIDQFITLYQPLAEHINRVFGTVETDQMVLQGSSDTMSNSLEDLRGKAELIKGVVGAASEGDLSGEMMEFSGDEQIDHVATSIRKMLIGLNNLITDIQKSGIQVTSSATEIAATAKEQEATVTEQAATTNEITSSAKEISSTSKVLVATMAEVAEVAEATSHSATESQVSLLQMESTMGEMVEATESIGSKLSVINEKASNINTVVTTIAKVADQTNLLSLNAAIEAEKAGEYGAGFSVVATEIRRLADQTAVATWDIEQMVKEMQASVSSGVMGMETFTEKVQRGVDNVRDVSGQLADIIEKVQALIPRFEYVREGMQSQSADAAQISDSIEQLSEAAQQTAESLRYSNTAIAELNEAAQSLQGAVSLFKLSEE